MSAQRKKREVSQGPEPRQFQIQLNGKPTTIRVHSPAFVLETVFEKLRSKLITQALQVTKDRSISEDIVQASLLNAFCWLNNGTLYAIKLQQGFLIVRGDGSTSTRSPRRRWYEMQEEAHKQRLLKGVLGMEEKYDKEVVEPAMQKEWLAQIIERWLKGIPVVGMDVIEEPSA